MEVSTVFSLGGAVIGLLSGGKPGLLIAGIPLQGHDSPNSMPFGSEQKVKTHDLPGGRRVFDLMGAYPLPVSFSGILQGPGAVAKARRLEAALTSGKRVGLTWADFSRSVVVQSAEFEYGRLGYEVPYRVTVLPVPTPAEAGTPGPLERVGKDLADALGLSGLSAGLQEAQGAIQAAQAVLPGAAGVVSPKLAGQVRAYLASASAITDGVRTAAEGDLKGFATAGAGAAGLTGGASASASAAALLGAASAAGNLAASVTASGYLERAAATIKRATT